MKVFQFSGVAGDGRRIAGTSANLWCACVGVVGSVLMDEVD
ncbi:hypothetical protein AB0E69_24255 [Kribbella sp. NPDC026611]